eukprot:g227.t1
MPFGEHRRVQVMRSLSRGEMEARGMITTAGSGTSGGGKGKEVVNMNAIILGLGGKRDPAYHLMPWGKAPRTDAEVRAVKAATKAKKIAKKVTKARTPRTMQSLSTAAVVYLVSGLCQISQVAADLPVHCLPNDLAGPDYGGGRKWIFEFTAPKDSPFEPSTFGDICGHKRPDRAEFQPELPMPEAVLSVDVTLHPNLTAVLGDVQLKSAYGGNWRRLLDLLTSAPALSTGTCTSSIDKVRDLASGPLQWGMVVDEGIELDIGSLHLFAFSACSKQPHLQEPDPIVLPHEHQACVDYVNSHDLDEFDWRDSRNNRGHWRIVPEAGNQNHCGGCYAYAFAKSMTARLRVQMVRKLRSEGKTEDEITGELKQAPKFTPWYGIGCSEMNQGCEGGYPHLMGQWSHIYGLAPETPDCIPRDGWQAASGGKCQLIPKKCPSGELVYRTKNARYLGLEGYALDANERIIQRELYENGPFTASVIRNKNINQSK